MSDKPTTSEAKLPAPDRVYEAVMAQSEKLCPPKQCGYKKKIAALEAQLAEAKAERDETYIDDDGNAWGRPTAWAYYSACKSMQRLRDRLAAESAARLQAEKERDEAKQKVEASEELYHAAHRWMCAYKDKLAAAEQELERVRGGVAQLSGQCESISALESMPSQVRDLARDIATLLAALLAPQQEEGRGDGS